MRNGNIDDNVLKLADIAIVVAMNTHSETPETQFYNKSVRYQITRPCLRK